MGGRWKDTKRRTCSQILCSYSRSKTLEMIAGISSLGGAVYIFQKNKTQGPVSTYLAISTKSGGCPTGLTVKYPHCVQYWNVHNLHVWYKSVPLYWLSSCVPKHCSIVLLPVQPATRFCFCCPINSKRIHPSTVHCPEHPSTVYSIRQFRQA